MEMSYRAVFTVVAAMVIALGVGTAAEAVVNLRTTVIPSVVMLVVQVYPDESGSGSGFVVQRDAQSAIIATNAHVARPHGKAATSITVIYGSGTQREFSLPGEVIGADSDLDLAFVRVRNPPSAAPLALADPSDFTETADVTAVGFPFGDRLASQQGKHAAATVSRGIISNLSLADNGLLRFVQVDADINPGNSGGPVVGSDGKVIGIASRGYQQTDVGFVLSSGLIRSGLDGLVWARPEVVTPSAKSAADGLVSYGVVDPSRRIRRIDVFTGPRLPAADGAKPSLLGQWPPCLSEQGSKPVQAVIKDMIASATIPLAPAGEAWIVQARWTTVTGATFWTELRNLPAADGPSSDGIPTKKGGKSVATLPAKPGDDWISEHGQGESLPATALPDYRLFATPISDGNLSILVPLESTVFAQRLVAIPGLDLVFALLSNGTIVQCRPPDFTPQLTLALGTRAQWLAPANGVLLVGLALPSEIAFLAPKTMKITRKVSCSAALDEPPLFDSGSDSLLVSTVEDSERRFHVLNGNSGKIGPKLDLDLSKCSDEMRQNLRLHPLAVASFGDSGRCLFAMASPFGFIARFRIKDKSLQWEESIPFDYGGNTSPTIFTGNSDFFAGICGDRRVVVRKAMNLAGELFTLPAVGGVVGGCFDGKDRRFILLARDQGIVALSIFDTEGKLVQRYPLSDDNSSRVSPLLGPIKGIPGGKFLSFLPRAKKALVFTIAPRSAVSP